MTDLYICIMISPSLSIATHKRIEELDFLKSIFILLMVAFHLLYFADHYPLLKQWVYTFHMPGFLLISGYLMPVNNVSSTNSEQSKLCINSPLQIDARLLWEQAIGSNGT